MSISNLMETNSYDLQCNSITVTDTISIGGDIGGDNISAEGDLFFGADAAGSHVLSAGASTDVIKTDYVRGFSAGNPLSLNVDANGNPLGDVFLPYASNRETYFTGGIAISTEWQESDINGTVISCNYNPLSGAIDPTGNASMMRFSDASIMMQVADTLNNKQNLGIANGVPVANQGGSNVKQLYMTSTNVFIDNQPVSKYQSDSFAPVDDSVPSHDLVAGSALMNGIVDASHFIINYDTSGDLGAAPKDIVIDNTLSPGSSITLHMIGKSALAQALTFTAPATYTDTRDGSTGNGSFDILANAVVGRTYKFTYADNDVWYLESFETPTTMVMGAGLVATPSISFQTDTNTGMWSSGADNVDFTTNGVNRLNISNTGVNVSSGVLGLQNGAVGAPSLHLGDATSGLYRSALNEVSVAVAGGQELRVGSEVEIMGVPLLTTIGVVGAPAIANNVDPTTGLFFGAAGLEVDSVVAGVETLHVSADLVQVVPATAVLEIPDGTAALPSLYLNGSATTGIYSSGADAIDFSVATAQTLHVAADLVQVVGANSVVEIPDGTAALPSLYLNGSATTGIYSSGADAIDFSVATAQTLHVAADLVQVVGANAVCQLPNGVVGLPSLNLGDGTTGLYRSALDNVDVACAGANVLNVSATGLVVTGDVTADDFVLSTGSSIPFQLDVQYDVNNTDTSNIAVTNYHTMVDTAGAETRTLPDGTYLGQLKKITMYEAPAGNGVITITTPAGGPGSDTITLVVAGEGVLCLWTAGGWRVIALISGVAGSTYPVVA